MRFTLVHRHRSGRANETETRRAVRTLGEFVGAVCLLCNLVAPVHGASVWERAADGRCVRVWNASELGRGPIAMTNGVMLPFRAFAGGVRDGGWGSVLVPVAVAAGCLEGASWLSAGAVDLLTGGFFAVTPDGLARLRTAPLLLLPAGQRVYDEYDDAPGCTGDPLVPPIAAYGGLPSSGPMDHEAPED